jgi:hypothetical protein
MTASWRARERETRTPTFGGGELAGGALGGQLLVERRQHHRALRQLLLQRLILYDTNSERNEFALHSF